MINLFFLLSLPIPLSILLPISGSIALPIHIKQNTEILANTSADDKEMPNTVRMFYFFIQEKENHAKRINNSAQYEPKDSL